MGPDQICGRWPERSAPQQADEFVCCACCFLCAACCAETVLLALRFASEADNSYLRVGYNSLGAYATINHLHFQVRACHVGGGRCQHQLPALPGVGTGCGLQVCGLQDCGLDWGAPRQGAQVRSGMSWLIQCVAAALWGPV